MCTISKLEVQGTILRYNVTQMISAGFHVWVMSDFEPSSVHLWSLSAEMTSSVSALVVVSLLRVKRIRFGEEVVYCGQLGDLESLYVFGSPLRTKDNQ